MFKRILSWFKKEDRPFNYEEAREYNIRVMQCRPSVDVEVKMVSIYPQPIQKQKVVSREDILGFIRNVKEYARLMKHVA